ncbi:MAG: hypothetical protein AAF684_05565 [Pseudomonadota bacterium]
MICALACGLAGAAAAQDWTPEELEELRARFILLDLDGDEQVRFEDMAQERLRQFDAFDENGDGAVAIGEFMGFRAPGADRYLTRRQFELRRYTFYKTDFDLDRSLSDEEFLFDARKNFNNLDADRDGIVTFTEFSRLPIPRANNAARLERRK